jgi:oxalate decarboxylase
LPIHAPEEFAGGTMRVVSEREFPISSTMTGALLVIKPGGLRELHWHPIAEQWQYYLKGKGRMTVFGSHGRARTDDFAAGDVGYVPQGFGHNIENIGDADLEIVLVLTTPPINRSRSPLGWPRCRTSCSPPI